MTRRLSGALAGALVAGSIGITAVPAQAQGCRLGEIPQEQLVSTGSPIQIYAGRVPGYAVAVADVAADYATCIAMAQVSCVGEAGPTLPLVEVDPETLTVTIYDQNVVGDTRCIYDPR
ncbi:MAG TPA: hypothetical protein VEU29_01185 [Actinomycetota bacterium]|nr:hypothetical protein [Actinomycetota bacterium]